MGYLVIVIMRKVIQMQNDTNNTTINFGNMIKYKNYTANFSSSKFDNAFMVLERLECVADDLAKLSEYTNFGLETAYTIRQLTVENNAQIQIQSKRYKSC